jgi:hypothetical protein
MTAANCSTGFGIISSQNWNLAFVRTAPGHRAQAYRLHPAWRLELIEDLPERFRKSALIHANQRIG